MLIDDKTRSILINKLQFTPLHINQLEKNTDLLSKTLGLLELIKRSTNRNEIRAFVSSQLKKIRLALNRSSHASSKLLTEARADHYTFQRKTKTSPVIQAQGT